jgi:hypothetical protein
MNRWLNDDVFARAINTASGAAQEVVLEYAARFKREEDYEPLEDLAADVQRAVVEAGCAVAKAARDEA